MQAPLISTHYTKDSDVLATWGEIAQPGEYLIIQERQCLCGPEHEHGNHYYAFKCRGKYTRYSALYIGTCEPTGECRKVATIGVAD